MDCNTNVKNKDMIAEILKNNLGIGESSSIALAKETKNALLILDDDRARKFALKTGLAISGTLTIIGSACDLGYIDSYEDVCNELRQVNFRFNNKVQEEVKNPIICSTFPFAAHPVHLLHKLDVIPGFM